jgi:hypothetical protein
MSGATAGTQRNGTSTHRHEAFGGLCELLCELPKTAKSGGIVTVK